MQATQIISPLADKPVHVRQLRENSELVPSGIKKLCRRHGAPGTVPRQNIGMVNNVAELWLSWDVAKTA
jgi:hypothetical protein